MDHYYTDRDKMLLHVTVADQNVVPHHFDIVLPQELTCGKPLIISKEIKGDGWNMSSLEVLTKDGVLVRFCSYSIEAEQVTLLYKLNRLAVCFRVQYQGSNRYHVSSKRTIELEQGQYHVVAMKTNGEKIKFTRGNYTVVELYIASAAMDLLKPYLYNYWSIHRKQIISKMDGRSPFSGSISNEIHQIVNSLYQYTLQGSMDDNSPFKYEVVHLFALAIRNQEEGRAFEEKTVGFQFNLQWLKYLSEPIIQAGAVVGCNSILLKGALGCLLLQTTWSGEKPVWNFVSRLERSCSIHIIPNSIHYAFMTALINDFVVGVRPGVEIKVRAENARFFSVSPGENIFQFQEGVTRVIHLYIQEPRSKKRFKTFSDARMKLKSNIEEELVKLPVVSPEDAELMADEEKEDIKSFDRAWDLIISGKAEFVALEDVIRNMPGKFGSG
ncbi:hypothetical protein [Olivibacter domesticus]|nr:hypothetical protein [Olivibacter domesticus]